MPSTATDRLNGLSTSVAIKAPVYAVTSSNITLAGWQTIGGVDLEDLNDQDVSPRVLVKDQDDASENGIYIASSGNWRRAKDFDGNRDVAQGTLVLVRTPTVDGALYEVVTEGPIIIGTTDIEFALRYGANVRYDQTPAEVAAGVTPRDYAYPEGHPSRYGLVNDGTTVNDFSPLEALHLQGVPITFPAGSGYVTQSTVTFAGNASVQMLAPIICDFSSVQVGVVIGNSANTTSRRNHHIISVRRVSYADWTVDITNRTAAAWNDIGCLIHNSFSHIIEIREATGWRVGVEGRATGGNGWTHNHVILGDTSQNLVHLRLTTLTLGYVNGNRYYGGRYTNFGSSLPDNADKSYRRGVLIDSRDGSYVISNQNTHYGPTFQVEGGVGIEIAAGNENQVIGGRSEMGVGSYAALFGGASAGNKLHFLYATTGDSERVRYESTANASNTVKFGRYDDLDQSMRVLFAADSLINRYAPYDANTTTVEGMSFKRLVGGASNSFVRTGGNIGGAEPVEANYTDGTLDLAGWAVGVRVETHTVKSFVLEIEEDTASASDHFFLVQCFDSSGTRLDATSSPGPYVVGSGRTNETFSTVQQGAYRTATGAGTRVSFRVLDSVAWVWVGVGRTTAATAKIKSFRLLTHEHGGVSVTPGHSSAIINGRYAASSPQTLARGTWKTGDIVWNGDPAAGERVGWICSVGGTPGTWLQFGAIQRSETYTASNVTTDRTFDANATTTDELADVLGTLINDLKSSGVLS